MSTKYPISLSLGTQKSTALDQAVTALVNAGIIMVVSKQLYLKDDINYS